MSEYIVKVDSQPVFKHSDKDIADTEFDLRARLSASINSRFSGKSVSLTCGKSVLRTFPLAVPQAPKPSA